MSPPTRSGPVGTGPQMSLPLTSVPDSRQRTARTTAEARAARDVGAQMAADSAHTSWRLAAEAAIRRLAGAGGLFTADDVHNAVGGPPGHVNAVGGLMIGAAKRGIIVADGYRQSSRPEAHARAVRTWRGVRPPSP